MGEIQSTGTHTMENWEGAAGGSGAETTDRPSWEQGYPLEQGLSRSGAQNTNHKYRCMAPATLYGMGLELSAHPQDKNKVPIRHHKSEEPSAR